MTPQQLLAYQMMMGGQGQGAGQSAPWMQGQPWMQSPGMGQGANPQLLNMLLASRMGGGQGGQAMGLGGQMNPQQLALLFGGGQMNPQMMALLLGRLGGQSGQIPMTGGFQ